MADQLVGVCKKLQLNENYLFDKNVYAKVTKLHIKVAWGDMDFMV